MIDFFRWIESFAQDLRYGARNLRRAPGLVVVSMLSLALGFGLNLTLYAGVNTIFRHQPTVNDPAGVVGIEPGNGRQYLLPELSRPARAGRLRGGDRVQDWRDEPPRG